MPVKKGHSKRVKAKTNHRKVTARRKAKPKARRR